MILLKWKKKRANESLNAPAPLFLCVEKFKDFYFNFFLDFQSFLKSGDNPKTYGIVTLSCSDVYI